METIPYKMDIEYGLSIQGQTGQDADPTAVGYLSNENITLTANKAVAPFSGNYYNEYPSRDI